VSSVPYDGDGQAREALSTAVNNFGVRILSNPQMLGNVFRDLLPDSPREVSLLVAAAEANVASLLQDRIGKHMDPDTAARLTASDLVQLRALDSVACLWATGEFARALGYPISDAAISTPIGTRSDEVSAVRGWPAEPTSAPPEATPPPGGGMPPPAGTGEQDRTRTQGVGGFASGGPGRTDGWDQPVPPSGGRRRLLIPSIAAVVVVAGVAAALLLSHHPAKGGLGSTTTTRTKSHTTVTSPPQTTTTTTPPTSNPPSLTPLGQLVPEDDQDPSTCVTNTATSSDAGVRNSLKCDDPDLNGTVYALQFQTFGAYESSLASLNSSENFNASDAAPECPASSGDQGIQSYSFTNFPAENGQVVECFIDTAGLTYLWTLPSENAYLLTTQEDFSTVNSWWNQQFADPDS
jgi:hypothetical protein